MVGGGAAAATPSEGWGAKELHRDAAIGAQPKSGPEVKEGRITNGAPKRRKCKTR